jgi:ABC-type Fe3+ transport system substrate-binding protein
VSVRWRSIWLVAALPAACDVPERAAAPEPDAGAALVVYAPAANEPELARVFAHYTETTGIAVDLRALPDPEDVLEGGAGAPAADLLIMAGADVAVRAADDGLLRPLAAAVASGAVDGRLRDPDGAWLAVAWRPAVIAWDVRALPAGAPEGYASLAGTGFRSRLCLTSFDQAPNRAVIAGLIGQLDAKPAERVVRGWLANLKEAPLGSEAELLEAIAGGRCAAGIVRSPPGGHSPAVTGTLRYSTPAEPAGELLAAGVARHASQPDAALELLSWLATSATLPAAAREAGAAELPALNLAASGWLHEDARKLAERAGYR